VDKQASFRSVRQKIRTMRFCEDHATETEGTVDKKKRQDEFILPLLVVSLLDYLN
jgi:hypothetical protein